MLRATFGMDSNLITTLYPRSFTNPGFFTLKTTNSSFHKCTVSSRIPLRVEMSTSGSLSFCVTHWKLFNAESSHEFRKWCEWSFGFTGNKKYSSRSEDGCCGRDMHFRLSWPLLLLHLCEIWPWTKWSSWNTTNNYFWMQNVLLVILTSVTNQDSEQENSLSL